MQCAISSYSDPATVVLESMHRLVDENFAMVTELGASCKAVLMLPMILCVAIDHTKGSGARLQVVLYW